LSAGQKRHLDAFLRFCPKAHELRRFILKFRAMLRWRSAKKLGTWIKSAAASEFRFTAQFASTLRRDLEAVKLSITTPWSNGPIEGHINRLKPIKRQMYGRADEQGSNFSKRGCCLGRLQTPLKSAPKVRKIRFESSATAECLAYPRA
jgi:transposase